MSSPGSGGSPFDFLARFAGPIAWLIAGLLLLFGGLCLGCHWSFTMCGGIFCVGRPLVGWMWLWGKVFFLFNDIESFLHSMDLTLNLFIVRRNQSDLTTWQKMEGVVTRRWEFLGRCPRSCIESEKRHGISKWWCWRWRNYTPKSVESWWWKVKSNKCKQKHWKRAGLRNFFFLKGIAWDCWEKTLPSIKFRWIRDFSFDLMKVWFWNHDGKHPGEANGMVKNVVIHGILIFGLLLCTKGFCPSTIWGAEKH